MKSRETIFEKRMSAVAKTATIKNLYLESLLKLSNVVGAGVGYKVTNMGPTDQMSVVVAVEQKVAKEKLPASSLVPSRIDGIPTDVIETGRLRAFGSRLRPARPGCSIAHYESTAGTFGCLVERLGQRYILSNNHVLALINQAKIGDPILQPGPSDGGTIADQIATLAEFVPIDFGSEESECPWAEAAQNILNTIARTTGSRHRVMALKVTEGNNQVDAALALPTNEELVNAAILDIGIPAGVAKATLGTRVKKTGRTTGFTTGTIQTVEMTTQIEYDGRKALFQDQYLASPLSKPGDSGSIVLDENDQVIGLLFAGSDRATIINPIEFVLEALDVTIVTG